MIVGIGLNCELSFSFKALRGGGGGGGGGHPHFLILLFEIAVYLQTKTRDQTFDGVPNLDRPPVPAVQPRRNLVNFWPNYAKSPQHAQNQDLGALLVASGLRNSYMNFDTDWRKWLSYEQKAI